jgi:acyl-CoA synthetase (AMP-forming)/AMP-acid ligase II
VPSALIRRLDDHARRRPHAVALREITGPEAERSVTWRRLRASVLGLARRLERAPAGAVAVCAGNRSELPLAILAGLCAGRDVLPVAPDAPAAERAQLFRRVPVSILLAEPPVLEAHEVGVHERIALDAIELEERTGGDLAAPAGAGSLLLQSSGTTGLPKVVRRSAAALDAVGNACRLAIGVDESDTMLLCIPLHHSYGIDQGILTAVMAGCQVELHVRFDPAAARTALAEHGISVFPGVPLMFDALARGTSRPALAPALRRAFSAGSPLPRRIFDRFMRSYGVPVGQIYGATEFGSVTWNDPERAGFDPEQAGCPMQGVRIRILDANAPQLARPLAVGCEGQVAVSAPSLFSGYVGADGSPAPGSFFLTGDLGRLDENGALWLTGRTQLLVDVGGRKVNPLEVESVLAQHPAVRDAVALGIPYTDTARRLKVIVVPEPGHELCKEELRRFAREHLTPYKVPRSFEIRTTVPRSPTGKILRQELR